jgi:NDP-sugar pyrophosphorylase family protein
MVVKLVEFIAGIEATAFRSWAHASPWALTGGLEGFLAELIGGLSGEYAVSHGIAVHRSARVELGAVVKPPAVLSAASFVAANAYVRGGAFIGESCVVGPGVEIKTSVLFARSKIAHLSFVGDSVVGERANCEAGAMIANYRNEREDKRIRIRIGDAVIDTGVEKFGALVGDDARIGANAVVAPGALIHPRSIVPRLSLVDHGA